MVVETSPSSSLARWLLIAVVAGAVVVRVGLMAGGLGRLDDPDHYLDLARSLIEGRGFSLNDRPTAYRPPLYPIVLAPLVGGLSRSSLPWGVGALHLALGVGTVWLVYLTARRWGFSTIRATIAAGIVAFDPVLVGQSRVVMTETLAAFLVAATLAGLTVNGLRGAALGGFVLGMASLCRPSFLPAVGLIAAAGLAFRPGGWKIRVRRTGLFCLVTALTLLPWAQRNASIFGEPVWTTTHGGYTLALANNWAYYQDVLDGPPGAVWGGINQRTWMLEIERKTFGMSEPQADRFLRSEAIRIAVARPTDFARASVERFKRFWGLAPAGSVYPSKLRWATMAWTLPVWVALAVGLFRGNLWRWPDVAAPSIVLALSLVHLVYWTDLRMRSPLVPSIALIAVGARFGRPGSHRGEGGVARVAGSNLTISDSGL